MYTTGIIFIGIVLLAIALCGVISVIIERKLPKESETYFDGERLYNELDGYFSEMKAAYESGDRVRIYNANVAEMQFVDQIKQLISVQDDSTMNFLPANDIGWMMIANAVNKPVQKRQYWYRQIGALVQEINTYRYIHENAPIQVN